MIDKFRMLYVVYKTIFLDLFSSVHDADIRSHDSCSLHRRITWTSYRCVLAA